MASQRWTSRAAPAGCSFPIFALAEGQAGWAPGDRRGATLVTNRLGRERVGDPDVIHSFGRPTAPAQELLDLNRRRWDDGTAATFAICDAADECAGHVFINLSGERRGSVGYWLLPRARGKGLATRAVRLVSAWALRDLGLARLALLTEPSNRLSQGVAERSGL